LVESNLFPRTSFFPGQSQHDWPLEVVIVAIVVFSEHVPRANVAIQVREYATATDEMVSK
jgi:hypothetical protein